MNRESWVLSSDELASALDAMRPVVAEFARRDADRLTAWSAEGSPAPRRCRRRPAVLVIPER